ncbi:MAG: radical SAM family heme chaperone HemW [Clostridiales bacterium]|nr:radical SAM family heme chaperone HemW [Clostridiales bacterium]
MEKDLRPRGLYIHIPFCSSKCDYCDFVSFSMDNKAQELYLDALCTEMDLVKNDYNDVIFDSIFIGGGTPSIVYNGFISGMLRKVYSSFHIADDAEISIEVNPSSFDKDKFFEYVQAGVNRISVGVQCLDSKLLAKNGRNQTKKHIKETFSILKNSEFVNVSADLMIGLPEQKSSKVMKTAKFLVKNNVKHISTYGLQIERRTILADKIRRGLVKPHDDEHITKTYYKVADFLKKKGFIRYEVSNFARPGFECRHNMKYWNHTQYLGLGVSAYSFIDGYRFFNTKRLDTYIDNLSQGKSVIFSKEYLSIAEKRMETIMLGLRRSKGLNLAYFQEFFGEDILATRAMQIRKLLDNGMIEISDGYLRITDPYFYVSNSIMLELI